MSGDIVGGQANNAEEVSIGMGETTKHGPSEFCYVSRYLARKVSD